jgi:hypothetical protein
MKFLMCGGNTKQVISVMKKGLIDLSKVEQKDAAYFKMKERKILNG